MVFENLGDGPFRLRSWSFFFIISTYSLLMTWLKIWGLFNNLLFLVDLLKEVFWHIECMVMSNLKLFSSTGFLLLVVVEEQV